MLVARVIGEEKGPEGRWEQLQRGRARVRVGGRAKGGGEVDGPGEGCKGGDGEGLHGWNCSKEITRIDLGLHIHQPIKVMLEVLNAKNSPLQIACNAISIMVDPNVKILVAVKGFPWILGNKRSQALVCSSLLHTEPSRDSQLYEDMELPTPISHSFFLRGGLKVNNGKLLSMIERSLSESPRNMAINEALRVLFSTIYNIHDKPDEQVIVKLIRDILPTIDNVRCIFLYAITTPKLAPPPPVMAQKRSSPIDFRSRSSPCTFTSCASTMLSTDKPYFPIILPYPPPLKWPPTPTVGQTPAGKPWILLFSAIL
ncbi:hypothetical protein DVH24_011180 [Malus domestica]|uniref:Uncharacterized protein n=1 Tax=Malus domestica TaxID=3750 RepID=A0A498JUK1_MALDO|nr:hypothetical protein DVH24_011180 [Malus domestica]